MPQVLLSDSVSAELGAQEPWPSDVRLFQPFEVEQILLAESAACLSVSAFLRMCQLDYRKDERANAEFMSPSGQVPFIKSGAFVVAELDHIVTFVAHKNVSLTEQLDSSQKADMRAYMSLVNNVLGTAELYVTWRHQETYATYTYPRHSSVYPWPLKALLTSSKRRNILRRLHLLGWRHKTLQEVYAEVDNCCHALSNRLENSQYFFGNSPTELDAVVFGHLFTLLTTPLTDQGLASVVKSYPTLVTLCRHVEAEFFKKGIREIAHVTSAPSGRSSRVEGGELLDNVRSGRSSRNDGDLNLRSGRSSRAEEEVSRAPGSTGSSDKNGSNGDYDKLDDIAQLQEQQSS